MKTRVLWVGEATFLNTGYAVYGRELFKRLYKNKDLDLAEMACYGSPDDPRRAGIPWKYFPVMPSKEDVKTREIYNSNPANQFGEGAFDSVINAFKPHVVIDIRDVFMFDFIDRSPARKYFHWIAVPTVDASPQNEQWLDVLSRVDTVMTYQNWSQEVLATETNNKLNLAGSVDPAAAPEFQPRDKLECKKSFGLEDFKVIGTVMRNQRRKLYPELLETFARYLQKTKRNDVLLYCHTSYPDMGWDLCRIINDLGIASKVLFTYICKNCGHVAPCKFSDGNKPCGKCGKISCSPGSVQIGLNNELLSKLYNVFDLYVQYCNCEAMGMPHIEAAACGVPVIGTYYSALEDTLKRIHGIGVPLLKKYIECETGCQRAIPDDNALLDLMVKILDKPEEEMKEWSKVTRAGYERHYSWDKVADKFQKVINNINVDEIENRYSQPQQIVNIPPPRYELSNVDFAKFLIMDVLCQPERLFSLMHLRLEKDLNLGYKTNTTGGMYYNEMSALFAQPKQEQFNKEIAYNHFCQLRNRINTYEKNRTPPNKA